MSVNWESSKPNEKNYGRIAIRFCGLDVDPELNHHCLSGKLLKADFFLDENRSIYECISGFSTGGRAVPY
jgi:hypothetical protein